MMLRSLMAASKAVAHTYATWNPADKGAAVTLSGGNLIASTSGASAVRSTISKTSGKWYWENIFTSGGGCAVAVGTSTATLANFPGFDAYGWMYTASTGAKYHTNASLAYGAAYAAGDVIGIELDMDAGTLAFRKNNVSQGTAYTGLSGPLFAMTGQGASGSRVTTANFGATTFVYSPPAGFNAGLYN